jgi:hypothetical protein
LTLENHVKASSAPDVAMPFDPFSPIAPARIRVLVLPVGRIKKSRFETFCGFLKEIPPVQLRDLCSDERVSNSEFDGLSFLSNSITYMD